MKLLILGATGRVGSEVTRRALEDGHHVTAFIRNPEKLTVDSAALTIFKGDVLNQEDLDQVMKGHDAVISAISTDGGSTLSEATPKIVRSMEKAGLSRLISVGTAGILTSRQNAGKYRYETNESKRTMTRAAEEHRQAFETLQNSQLDWTVVCPTYLPNGESEGRYRVEANHLPMHGERISVCDAADFVYRQLSDDSYICKRVGIAY